MWSQFGTRRSGFDMASRQFAGYEYYVTDSTTPDTEAGYHLRYGQPWASTDSGVVYGRVLTRIEIDEDAELGLHMVTAIYTIPQLGTGATTLGYLYPSWLNWADAPLKDKATPTAKTLERPFVSGGVVYRWRVAVGPKTRQIIVPAYHFDVELAAVSVAPKPLSSLAPVVDLTPATAITAIEAVLGKVNSDDVSSKVSGGTAGKLWAYKADTQPMAFGRSRVRVHLAKVPAEWGTTWDAAVTVVREEKTVTNGRVDWIPDWATTETRQWFNTAAFSTIAGWIR
jgi:hypothetical protein